jgi:multidrug transporter EmrE-like cation transporter
MWRMALILGFGSLCAAAGQVLLKLGASGRTSPLEFMNLRIAGGLAFYLLGTVAWIYGLSKVNLTVVYAFTALTFVLVYMAGFWLLDERIAVRGWVGIGFVLAGLLLVWTQHA